MKVEHRTTLTGTQKILEASSYSSSNSFCCGFLLLSRSIEFNDGFLPSIFNDYSSLRDVYFEDKSICNNFAIGRSSDNNSTVLQISKTWFEAWRKKNIQEADSDYSLIDYTRRVSWSNNVLENFADISQFRKSFLHTCELDIKCSNRFCNNNFNYFWNGDKHSYNSLRSSRDRSVEGRAGQRADNSNSVYIIDFIWDYYSSRSCFNAYSLNTDSNIHLFRGVPA